MQCRVQGRVLCDEYETARADVEVVSAAKGRDGALECWTSLERIGQGGQEVPRPVLVAGSTSVLPRQQTTVPDALACWLHVRIPMPDEE